MRPLDADWQAVYEALAPHHRATLVDYAATKGLSDGQLWDDAVVRTIAVALAVDRVANAAREEGQTVDRRALLQAAIDLDLDIETLLRRERRTRQRRRAAG